MAVSFLGLFALAGLAALVFLAVLGLITVLTNPKTRDIAKILFGAAAAFALLIVLVGGMYLGVSRREAVRREATVARLTERALQMHNKQTHEQVVLPEAADSVLPPPDPRTREGINEATESDELKASEEAGDEAADAQPISKPEPTPEPEKDATGLQEEAEKPDEETTAASEAPQPATEEAAKEAATVVEKPQQSDTAELSVAPLPEDNRPAWVDRKPYKEGSVYYWPVAADPRPDLAEAEEEALPIALNGAVADYVRTKLKLGARAGQHVHLESDYLRDSLVGADVWVEPLSLSLGEFVRVHALVKFDREANSIIHEAWDHQRLAGRLWSAGGFLALVLFFLALVYCYLKIDQVAAGPRRRLLRFAAILVILGLMLVAAGVASVGIA